MGVKFFEGDGDQLFENLAAETSLRGGNYDSLEFDGAGVFAESAQEGVGLQLARFGFADEVAGVSAGEGGQVAVFRPLADEGAAMRSALDGDDAGEVGGNGRAKEHGIQIN